MWNFKKDYEKLWKKLWLNAISILKNADEASDTVQDVFLNLLEKSDKHGFVPENTENFLMKSVRNKSFDKLRYVKGKPTTSVESNLNLLEKSKFSDFENCNLISVIEDMIELNSIEESVWSYIKSGYTNKEIAEEIGEDADFVRRRRYSIIRKAQRVTLGKFEKAG